MQLINYQCNGTIIPKKEINLLWKNIFPEIQIIKKVLDTRNWNDSHCSALLPSEKTTGIDVQNIVKKIGHIDYLFIVGIGGSNLGTLAVVDAVLGKLHNYKINTNKKGNKKEHEKRNTQVFFADTVDEDTMHSLCAILETACKSGKKVLINGISKSGSTTETIANLEILISVLKKYDTKYYKRVVITTDKDSLFSTFAKKQQFSVLEIPKSVGGRYSVFSAVGLFPLAVLGIDIKKLLQGANDMIISCMNNLYEKNIAAQSAINQYYQYKIEKKNISDLFLFSSDLESLGKWYRQLLSESCGKNQDAARDESKLKRGAKNTSVGITPTVSLGSTDLHSVGQLYLAGPKDKFITFVQVLKNHTDITVPKQKEYDVLVSDLQGKDIHFIMNAILHGIRTACTNQKISYANIILPDKSEYSIGQFLQFKMLEVMYLAKLLNVNAFNQPEVELYKRITRKELKKIKE